MFVLTVLAGLLPSVLGLMVAIVVGYRQKGRWRALALGVPAGLATMLIAGITQHFLGYVVPFGQIEFWLASLLAQPVQDPVH